MESARTGPAIAALFVATPPAVQFDIATAASPDDLWRLMHETFPGRAVFLPFDDPIFAGRPMRMQFDQTAARGTPQAHFDAFIQLPVTRRVGAR